MKHTFYALFLVGLLSSCADTAETKEETKGETVHFDKFNWTMNIPDGFEMESEEEWAKLQQKGTEAIEETFEQEIEGNAKTIVVFKQDETNYFDANYQSFDTATDGNYLKSCTDVNQVIYETFLAQMPDVPIDSSSTTETIDGLVFQKFNIVIQFPNEMKLTTHMYSRLFGDTELAVNIMYANEDTGKKMTDAWLKSSFK
tara:strand:- start:43794 stop:44393 length:600 start_codon:yes stop_codon:yes gene_type:complete